MSLPNQPEATLVKVLIIEDDFLVQMILEEFVQEAGHEVIAMVSDNTEAREVLSRGPPDLIIADVHLGEELVYAILPEVDPTTTVVLCTGYGAGGIEAPWRDLKTMDKPYGEREIRRILADVAAARSQ